MGWYKDILRILDHEPEVWLEYLYGQKHDEVYGPVKTKGRFKSRTLRILKVFMKFVRKARVRAAHCPEEMEGGMFLYVGTANQMHSLQSTIDALLKKGEKVACMVNPKNINANSGDPSQCCMPPVFSYLDALRASVLLFTRGYSFLRELDRERPEAGQMHYRRFLGTYLYLALFYRLFTKAKPGYVITANDHSAPNRCMLATASHLGIKTVYMQHASVSPIFPALEVDYAFLDGLSALEVYRRCESNRPAVERAMYPEVFLSGQKKALKKGMKFRNQVTGVALNGLDDVGKAIECIKQLAQSGLEMVVRWHPRQIGADVGALKKEFQSHEKVSLSDPGLESVGDFLSRIGYMVAANSSIHLEAAVSGVVPVYYQITPFDTHDYYGYVRRGVAVEAQSTAEIVDLVCTGGGKPEEDAVQSFCATYGTEWEGREGELVANHLLALRKGKNPSNLFGYISFHQQ